MLEFLPFVGIVLLFWLFVLRPAGRRQKELRRMQSSLSVGDDIVLTSGIYGTVVDVQDDVDEDVLLVQIASGVSVTVARSVVGALRRKSEDSTDPDDTGSVADAPEES